MISSRWNERMGFSQRQMYVESIARDHAEMWSFASTRPPFSKAVIPKAFRFVLILCR